MLDTLFEGANDFTDILPYCRETGTVLVTNNVRDFNTTDLSTDDHAGIVIVHNKDRPATENSGKSWRHIRLGARSEDLKTRMTGP